MRVAAPRQGRSLVDSLERAAAPKFKIKSVHQTHLKNLKKSISRGSGGRAKNSSKTWSKCHFLLLHRRKSGQKVGKTQSFIRTWPIFQGGPFFQFFHGFSYFFTRSSNKESTYRILAQQQRKHSCSKNSAASIKF